MRYQVGGSLTSNAPSYIDRQADTDLYAALERGDFCYVLNSRQMGKSSLLVQTRDRLQKAGYRCTVVDMTNIGSENITPLQWYKGVVKDLWRGFKLLKQVDVQNWWQDESDISLLQRLSRFISDIILPTFPDEPIVIFIDEIDSILSLPFSVDDFFALIRFCYNQRAIDPNYHRIRFAIFGVATPSDLIQDRQRTPFNVGTAIALDGFTLSEAQPLMQGLAPHVSHAPAILQAILDWTNGQPFLTQKLCQCVIHACQNAPHTPQKSGQPHPLLLPPGTESYWVDNLVHTVLLHDWESQDEPEHLRTIRNRILHNPDIAGRLLGLYQQILKEETPLLADDSPEQVELLLSGLVIKQRGILRLKNRIYATVFNSLWVDLQLKALRPYSQTLAAWEESQRQDESRLLRGQALQDAQEWAQKKRLSDLDYQFLAASVEHDRRQVQQALEADRIQAVEAQLHQERRSAKLQRQLLGTVGLALVGAIGFGSFTVLQYRQARISEIKALASSAEGNFDSHRQLEAMAQAIAAQTKLHQLGATDPTLQQQVQVVLRQVSDGITLRNQLDVGSGVQEVALRPDGQMIASVSLDGQVQLWLANGQRVRHWNAHTASTVSVDWSPDGQTIATASADQTIKLWRMDGTLLKTLPLRHPARQLRFSPNGQTLAVTTAGQHGYLLDLDGRILHEMTKTEQLVFSPNGQFLISTRIPPPPPPRSLGPQDGLTPPVDRPLRAIENIQIVRSDGQKIIAFPTEKGPIFAIAMHPSGQSFATASVDGAVSLWSLEGQLLKTFVGHPSNVRSIAFSPDGTELATASTDNTIRLWQTDGGLLKVLSGHQAIVRSVAFSPDGHWLISGSEDGQVKIWYPHHPHWQVLAGHTDTVNWLAFQPDGSQLLSASVDFRLNIWKRHTQKGFNALPEKTAFTDRLSVTGLAISPGGAQIAKIFRGGAVEICDRTGTLQQSLQAETELRSVTFHPTGDQFFAGGNDGTVQRWQRSPSGQFLSPPHSAIAAHQGAVRAVATNPQGTMIASGATDRNIKLWQLDGTPIRTLRGHQSTINALDFSPKGDWLASASSDNQVKLWRSDGQTAHTLLGHRSTVSAVQFSPDGQWVASASMDGTVKVWRLDGSLARTLSGHGMPVEAVAFSPDGRSIASAGVDRRVILWDWQTMANANDRQFACNWLQDYLRSHPTDDHQQICQ